MSGQKILSKLFRSVFAEEEKEDTRLFCVLYETIPKEHTCESLSEILKRELMQDEKSEWAKYITFETRCDMNNDRVFFTNLKGAGEARKVMEKLDALFVLDPYERQWSHKITVHPQPPEGKP